MHARSPALIPPVPVVLALLAALVTLLALVAGPAGGTGATRADVVPRDVWPLVPAVVVAPFAPPADRYAPGHRGVDLAGAPGQSVRAALPGVVSFRGQVAGRPVVVVDHGATRTTYEPVIASRVRGASVAAGEVIGTLSPLGSHCAPTACLHWGWRRGEEYLDPLLLLGGVRVRLLPSLPSLPAVPSRPPGPPSGATAAVPPAPQDAPTGARSRWREVGAWARSRW